jgi:hypothetical protein
VIGQLGMRQPLVERQRDRLFLSGVERIDAIAHRLRRSTGQQHLDGRRVARGQVELLSVVVIGGHRDRVQFPPPQLVQAPVAHDGGEPRQRLAFRRLVGPRVVPNAHERLLQDLLGCRAFSQDTHGDPV